MNLTEADHFIPSHFFEKGDYQVWSPRQEWKGGNYTGRTTMQLIADNLTLETAKAFNWPRKEIRKKSSARTLSRQDLRGI
jgi:hypothetical protein